MQHALGDEHVLHVPFIHVPPDASHLHCGVVHVLHAPQSRVPPQPLETDPHWPLQLVVGKQLSISTLTIREVDTPFAVAVIVTGKVPVAAVDDAANPTVTESPTRAGLENLTSRPNGRLLDVNVTGPAVPCVVTDVPVLFPCAVTSTDESIDSVSVGGGGGGTTGAGLTTIGNRMECVWLPRLPLTVTTNDPVAPPVE